MNAAEFQSALNVVEEDHELVLEKVQSLKAAVCCLLDPEDPAAGRVLDRLQEMNDYFATRFEAHLEEEESKLFPLLEQLRPEGHDLVAQLCKEHDEIRAKRAEFDRCLDIAFQVEDDLPKMVLRDLLAYGWELWELLDNHAHVETRAVHQCLALSLTDAVPTPA